MFSNFDEFRDLLLAKRDAGRVTVSLRNRTETNVVKEVNNFVTEHNFKSIDSWDEINESFANEIIVHVISVDMAYDFDLETKPIARELSVYFLDLFSSDKHFLPIVNSQMVLTSS
ncbi:hypothetical protein HOO54_12395 [Bacillus sp. WMMC1349]|uniref:hypothetical protein n=1 Tax=Bacillus sp. WMMC1349 TaxID=2736254 RepID=UPI001551ECD8|nr:hypothetical protein [Bacillus sp. WMMC1349]NPC93008.1 hypothetical protein [Bacillus sp. WMMC1349]